MVLFHEACKILPDVAHKLDFLAALAELEDNECHRTRTFPKTRLHRIRGIKQAIYRADINKISGWRIHLQYSKTDDSLHLKDIIEGPKHDDVMKVIKSKIDRYEYTNASYISSRVEKSCCRRRKMMCALLP